MLLYREFCDDVAAQRSWKNRSSKVGKVHLLSQANDMTHNEKNKRMRDDTSEHKFLSDRSVLMLLRLQYKSIV